MIRTIAITAVALGLLSQAAMADEHRGGDAALGALSGAVVLGPVGAVAGAVVGYTAGPSIARSWGFRRGHDSRQAKRSTRDARVAREARAEVPLPTPRSATSAAPPAPAAPPVQTLE